MTNNDMTFNEYQDFVAKTAVYRKHVGTTLGPWGALMVGALGLNGEAGEVAEKVKKVVRKETVELDDAGKKELAKELGDVMWYVADLASELGVKLEDVITENVQKLESRVDRGVTYGSGDNR